MRNLRASKALVRSTPRLLSRQYTVRFHEPDPSKPKLVLAYSGGLDTSCQLRYLTANLGFEVCAYIADLGQDDLKSQKDKDAVRDKALQSGAYAFACEDLREEFTKDFIFEYLKCGTLYERRYLMGTAVARPCISKRQVEIAHEEGAKHMSHGSTGKGNDQVRFELSYLALDPSLEMVTLWRDEAYCAKFQGRMDLIKFATEHGIPVGASKKHSYSEDENCLHISYEAGELEDPAFPGSGEYPGMVLKKKTVDIADAPDTPQDLRVHFQSGVPTKVESEGKVVDNSAFAILDYLNTVAGAHGVGRIDLVENRFVGLKSRGCYETPAGTVLHSALTDLELLTMDREVMRLRDSLGLKYTESVYNGFWFSPEMDFLRNAMDHAQRPVTGYVDVRLHKGNVMCRGRFSPHSLYSMEMVSMDEHGGFDPTMGTGFINTLSNRIKASRERDMKAGLDAHPLNSTK